MSVILLDRFDNPHLLLQDFAQAFGVAVAEFQHDSPMRFEEGRALGRQPPPVIQAIRAAVQRPARIMIPHLRLQ